MRRICPNCEYEGEETTCPIDGYAMVRLNDPSPGANHPLIDRIFGEQYRLIRLLGTGGMGWVFEALNLKTDQRVALKVMRRSEEADLGRVKRFYAEVRMTRQLTQPHTLRVYDFGSSNDGYLYMAMELLKGQPMSELLIREGPLEPRLVARILQQACYALTEAHELGVIHRDLKPENIFLCDIGSDSQFVKVVDFGVAKALEGDEEASVERITRTGTTVGTPAYMSPEQATLGPMDGRTDLYSLGVVAYEALCGKLPFDYDSPFRVLMGHIKQPPPPLPPSVNGRPIPIELRNLVMEMLAKDHADRPASAREVADRVTPYVAEGQPVIDSIRPKAFDRSPPVTTKSDSQGRRTLFRYVLPALTFVVMVAVGIWLMKGPFTPKNGDLSSAIMAKSETNPTSTSRPTGDTSQQETSPQPSGLPEQTVTSSARDNPEAAARELYLTTVNNRLERIRQCGKRHLSEIATGTDLRVTLSISVSREGSVDKVDVDTSFRSETDFLDCVRWHFLPLKLPASGLLVTVKTETTFKMTR